MLKAKEKRPHADNDSGTLDSSVLFSETNFTTETSELQGQSASCVDMEDQWQDEFIKEQTIDFLDGLGDDTSPRMVTRGLKSYLLRAVELYNLGPRDPDAPDTATVKEAYPNQRKGAARIEATRTLPNVSVGEILIRLHGARSIDFGDGSSGNRLAGVYVDDGPNRGIYDVSTDGIFTLARMYKPSLTDKDLTFVTNYIKTSPEQIMPLSTDQDLIPVNNGIFDYRNKELLDFDPDFVFTSKCHVDFVEDAENPVIVMPDGEPWDVESWMLSLCSDPAAVKLLWQGIAAAVRPHVDWKKSLWLYAPSGNNGKGTYIQLIRNLLGKGAHTSITFEDLKEQYMLEPLAHVQANLVDENNTGTYLPNAAKYKAVITHDVIRINRKYEKPIDMRFHGVDIQCVNGFPRVKDDSDSFYRRILPILFDNRFEGVERTYIKDEYLTAAHPEVLEYVLNKVLMGRDDFPDFYKFDEPESSKQLLGEYRLFNEPVRQFFEEVVVRTKWRLLPWDFLYDLFAAWSDRYNPSGGKIGKKAFTQQVKGIADEGAEFFYKLVESGKQKGKDSQVRSAGRITEPEPLIIEYNLERWMDKSYHGNDPSRVAMPQLKEFYRGLQRKSMPGVDAADATSNQAVDSDEE